MRTSTKVFYICDSGQLSENTSQCSLIARRLWIKFITVTTLTLIGISIIGIEYRLSSLYVIVRAKKDSVMITNTFYFQCAKLETNFSNYIDISVGAPQGTKVDINDFLSFSQNVTQIILKTKCHEMGIVSTFCNSCARNPFLNCNS